MKRIRNTLWMAVLLGGIALQGCSESVETAGVAAGEAASAFAVDAPAELAQGKLASDGKCEIDFLNGNRGGESHTWTVKRGDDLVVQGWTFSADGKSAVAPLFIRIASASQTYYATSSVRYTRPDVSEHFKLAPELTTGFDLRASTAQVEPGSYAIAILQPLPGRVEACEKQLTLIVN